MLAAFSCNTQSTMGRRSLTVAAPVDAGRSNGSGNGLGKLIATRRPSAFTRRRNATYASDDRSLRCHRVLGARRQVLAARTEQRAAADVDEHAVEAASLHGLGVREHRVDEAALVEVGVPEVAARAAVPDRRTCRAAESPRCPLFGSRPVPGLVRREPVELEVLVGDGAGGAGRRDAIEMGQHHQARGAGDRQILGGEGLVDERRVLPTRCRRACVARERGCADRDEQQHDNAAADPARSRCPIPGAQIPVPAHARSSVRRPAL